MSHTITIDKTKIRQKAYLITATKSRFAKDGNVSQDKYTFDLEDADREGVAELSGTHTGIAVTEPDIVETIQNVITIIVGNGALISGNAIFSLHSTIHTVALTNGDESTLTASQLREHSYAGWTASGTGTTVILTENSPTIKLLTAPTINFNDTEAAATVELSASSQTIKTVKLSYTLADLKADIVTLTKQKGRTLTDKNGISMMDNIAFSGKTATAITISPVKADVFDLCKHISARKGKLLATDTMSFDNIVMTDDDTVIFGKNYTRAFNDLVSEMSPLLDSFIADTSLTITAGFAGAISATNLKPLIENYLQESCLGQFYDIIGIQAEGEKHINKSGFYMLTIKNMLTSQADADKLLKSIITDAAVKAQTALYPLSRKALGTDSMYTYGATTLDLSFELREIPISSSAIQLIYNLVRGVLLNGALSKYYTMAGIADDKNEAKSELEQNLAAISFIIEDRLRFLGLFDQLFAEGTTKVREKLLGYSRELTVLDFVDTPETLTLTFEKPHWDEVADYNDVVHPNVNHLSILTAKVDEALYRYVTAGWWLLTNNELYSVDYPLFLEALGGISGILSRSAFVNRRSCSFL